MTTRVDGANIKDGDITEAKLQTSLNPSGTIDSCLLYTSDAADE